MSRIDGDAPRRACPDTAEVHCYLTVKEILKNRPRWVSDSEFQAAAQIAADFEARWGKGREARNRA